MSILQRRLVVEVVAFGFKHGIPGDLNLLFDVRFLRNPNWQPELQALTGNDPAVAAFIAADPATSPFLERLFALLDFLMPLYANERAELKIGIGCTGGQHRSVYIARRVCSHLESTDGVQVRLMTRDTAK